MRDKKIYSISRREISPETAGQIKDGDIKAFKLVFTTFWNPLLNYSLNIVNDMPAAENIVQDTFLDLWENRSKIDREKNLKTYIYTITRNKSLNFLKSHHEKKRASFNEPEFVESRELMESVVERKELTQEVLKAVEKLPEKGREIFIMSRYDNLKYSEISEILGISIKTVETQMSRNLKKLKELLARLLTFLIFLTFM